MAQSLLQRWSVYPSSWPKSVLHAASHMLSTADIWYCQKGQIAVGEKGKQLAELVPCIFAALIVASSHRACPKGSRSLCQLQDLRFQPQPLYLLFHQ